MTDLIAQLEALIQDKQRSAWDCANCGVEANLVEAVSNALRTATARAEALERERDELDFLLNEGGTWEAQLSKAEARAEAAESALSARSREVERLMDCLRKDPNVFLIAYEDGDHERLARAAAKANERAERLREALRTVTEFNSGENTTLGALHALADIRKIARQALEAPHE